MNNEKEWIKEEFECRYFSDDLTDFERWLIKKARQEGKFEEHIKIYRKANKIFDGEFPEQTYKERFKNFKKWLYEDWLNKGVEK